MVPGGAGEAKDLSPIGPDPCAASRLIGPGFG